MECLVDHANLSLYECRIVILNSVKLLHVNVYTILYAVVRIIASHRIVPVFQEQEQLYD